MAATTVGRFIVVLAVAAFCRALPAWAEDAAAERKGPWLWPPPQRVQVLEGGMPVKGMMILVPEAAGRRVTAIANALAKYVGFYHKVDVAVKPVKGAGTTPYALAIAANATEYGKLTASAPIDAIPTELADRRMWRRESYVLRTGLAGGVLAAPQIQGLLQGARTLMQMAKVAAKQGRDSLPAVNIVDWSDLPEHLFTIVGPYRYVNEDMYRQMSTMLGELKYTHAMFALYDGPMTYPLHPEVKTSCPAGSMSKFADYVRSWGVPTCPWLLDSTSGPKGLGRIVYYPNTDEFHQVKFEMMDDVLEAFRPDAFQLSMSEQYLAKRWWNGWKMSKKEYFDALTRNSNFCLRRGVRPEIWGDVFVIGGNFDPWEKVLDTDKEAVRRMPRELVIGPWDYANRENLNYGKVWETLAGKEFGYRAINGCATWGTDGTFHAQHMVKHGKELPLMWGLFAVVWGGGETVGGRTAVHRCAGSLWNCRFGTDANAVVAENKALVAATPFNAIAPDLLEPLGLEAVLWREPNRPIAEYVGPLADKDPLVWEDAREELVGFGAGGATGILQAMAESPQVKADTVYEGWDRPLRWKLEGVLSRICRDGRHNQAVGQLDVQAAEKFLDDPCSYVRDIAAELIASCAPRQQAVAIVSKGLAHEKTRASCARAAGVAGLAEIAGELLAIAANPKPPPADRAAAARYLGHLKPAEAEAKPLLAALKDATDAGLKKELIRTISLTGMKEAEAEIARNLDKAQDKFVRLRAAIALVNLKSTLAGTVESWLAEDDRAIVEIGCWALGRALGREEALKIIARNVEKQSNPTLKEALDYQMKTQLFMKW